MRVTRFTNLPDRDLMRLVDATRPADLVVELVERFGLALRVHATDAAMAAALADHAVFDAEDLRERLDLADGVLASLLPGIGIAADVAADLLRLLAERQLVTRHALAAALAKP